MENIIKDKLKKQNTDEYCDAFDYMLSAAKENDYNLTMQELKVWHSLKINTLTWLEEPVTHMFLYLHTVFLITHLGF